MSLNPSFRQTDSALNPIPALQALLVVSPDGRIQFATARANLWIRNLFTAASPLDRHLCTEIDALFIARNDYRYRDKGPTS